MTKILAALITVASLSACAHSEVVDLKKPGADTVHCGPFKASIVGDDKVEADAKLQDCIKEYQAQGYRRMD